MDILIKLLIFVHLMSLVVAMGFGFSLARAGSFLSTSSPEQKEKLFAYGRILSTTSAFGLLGLWVTGPLLVWLKYGGFADFGVWFWAKMAFVIILSAAHGMSSASFRRFAGGDVAAGARARMLKPIVILSGLATVLCAVFAFA